jgi:hypothetical protein
MEGRSSFLKKRSKRLLFFMKIYGVIERCGKGAPVAA